jgi:hypothetical protein
MTIFTCYYYINIMISYNLRFVNTFLKKTLNIFQELECFIRIRDDEGIVPYSMTATAFKSVILHSAFYILHYLTILSISLFNRDIIFFSKREI